MIFLTYQSGPRAKDLRTVLLTSKPKILATAKGVKHGLLQGELAEGQHSALVWWNQQLGRPADDTSFACPVELIRKVRMS